MKYSVRVNSLTELFITKLDVLSGLEEINLCTGYKYENEVFTDYPYKESIHYKAEPVYQTFDGWIEDISSVKNSSTLGPFKFCKLLWPTIYEITKRIKVLWLDVASLITTSISGLLKK